MLLKLLLVISYDEGPFYKFKNSKSKYNYLQKDIKHNKLRINFITALSNQSYHDLQHYC